VLFAREGATVVVAECDVAAGEETVRLANAAGGQALLVATDVTQPESVEAVVTRALATFGRLNILYNNAGGSTMADGPAPEVSLEEFWRAIKLDLYGTFLGCRFGIPALIRSGGGAVVNTASIVSMIGMINRDAYTAAKGGVMALTRSLAVHYARDGVRVNAVAPGVTLSPRVEAQIAKAKAGADRPMFAEQHLLGFCDPNDIAEAALYLASEESRRVTGHILAVDSGFLAA
jgi:NAD(P)-dependent dehydrogenase (short-subunit alcohol dehydrogenase family)